MASIIDEAVYRSGSLCSWAAGINRAAAADLKWFRETTETEADFLGRARRGAEAAGYRLVDVFGTIEVGNVIPLRQPAPRDVA